MFSALDHTANAAPQVWRQTLWTDIRTDVMEEGTKSFVKEVKALPKQIRDEDCFKVYSLPSSAPYMLACHTCMLCSH